MHEAVGPYWSLRPALSAHVHRTSDEAVAAAFEAVVAAASGLPEVEESTWYGTAALKVRTKSFARMWSRREHDRDGVHDTPVLVAMCDVDAKPMLMESSDGVLFETPHYHGYGALLVRLDDIDAEWLSDVLEGAYRTKAPATLVRLLDAEPL